MGHNLMGVGRHDILRILDIRGIDNDLACVRLIPTFHDFAYCQCLTRLLVLHAVEAFDDFGLNAELVLQLGGNGFDGLGNGQSRQNFAYSFRDFQILVLPLQKKDYWTEFLSGRMHFLSCRSFANRHCRQQGRHSALRMQTKYSSCCCHTYDCV